MGGVGIIQPAVPRPFITLWEQYTYLDPYLRPYNNKFQMAEELIVRLKPLETINSLWIAREDLSKFKIFRRNYEGKDGFNYIKM